MKKSLIALAVAGVLTAPIVAQADATLYGKVQATFRAIENNDVDLSVDDAIIGVKGSADTTVDGLSAIYKIEVEFNEAGMNSGLASENNAVTTRYAYAGVTGDFGTVLAGRIANPADAAEGFGDISNEAGNFWGNADRLGNALAYASPSFSGFDFTVGAVMDGGSTSASADVDGYALGLNYSAGDLSLSAGYQDFDDALTGTEMSAALVGGAYSFGPVTLGAAYKNAEEGTVETDTYGVNASYSAGAVSPYIMYSVQDSDDAAAEGNELALGLNYSLGKKAGVGVEYSSVDMDAASEAVDQFSVTYTVKF